MKRIPSVPGLVAATLALPLALFVSGCQSTPAPSAPRNAAASATGAGVTKLGGAARLTCDGRTWQKLQVGDGINSGCAVQTALNSFVEIVAASAPGSDGPKDEVSAPALRDRIVLEADSAVRFESLPARNVYTGSSDIRLLLHSGKVMCSSVASAESPVVEVRFGNTLVRGRSATFLVDARGTVQVARGAVAVTGLDALRGRAVSEGLELDVRTGALRKIPVGAMAERPAAAPAPAGPPPRLQPSLPARKY